MRPQARPVEEAATRRFSADPEDRDLIVRVARHLSDGGLLAYPTETVYGLGAVVTEEGVGAVRALKGRESDKPLIVLLPDGSDLATLGLEVRSYARALADAFWPGPLTLVLRDTGGRFPEGARSERGGVAVRVSPEPFVKALLAVLGRPILSTSANREGQPPAIDVEGLIALEGRPGSDRVWIADGGRRRSAVPSTVVDATGAEPSIVRPGRILESEIESVLKTHRLERAP